jgi:hypothetical protein
MYDSFAERQRRNEWGMLAFPQENLYIFPVLHDITSSISIWFDYNIILKERETFCSIFAKYEITIRTKAKNLSRQNYTLNIPETIFIPSYHLDTKRVSNSSIYVFQEDVLDTDNDYWDKHLKSDDFFNAEKYPNINFKNAVFEKVGDNKYKITGDLTIRDVTKKVTFDAVLNGTLKTDKGLLSAWKASTTINRFDYNLKWDKTIETGGLIVGQDVTITLNLELNK